MIQHKHFYLSTSAKLQSLLFQWDNSLLAWHSFAFPFILLEFYLHFRVSDLPAQFALSSTPFITLSPTLPCSSPPSVSFFLVLSFTHSPTPSLSFQPHLFSDETQMSSCSGGPLHLKASMVTLPSLSGPWSHQTSLIIFTKTGTSSLLIGVEKTGLSPNSR